MSEPVVVRASKRERPNDDEMSPCKYFKAYVPPKEAKIIDLPKRVAVEWYKKNVTEYFDYLNEKWDSVLITKLMVYRLCMNDTEYYSSLPDIAEELDIVIDVALLHEVEWHHLVSNSDEEDILLELDLNWNSKFAFDTPDHPFQQWLEQNGY